MKVKDIMTSGTVKYCGLDTKVYEAAKTMQAANCGALPVIDKEKKVVGIVTDRDICLSLAHDHGKAGGEGKISDVMTTRVHTVQATDEMGKVLHLMQNNKIGRLPVVDKQGRQEGIVSLHNIVNHSNAPTRIPGEDILKTVKALSERYSHSRGAKA